MYARDENPFLCFNSFHTLGVYNFKNYLEMTEWVIVAMLPPPPPTEPARAQRTSTHNLFIYIRNKN